MQFLTDKNIRFPRRPCLVADARVFEMPDGLGIQVRGCDTNFILRGPLALKVVPWLLPLLNGKLSAEEIVKRRPDDLSESQVLDLLWIAFKKGLITEADENVNVKTTPQDPTLQRQSLFWGRKLGLTRANATASAVEKKIATSQIALVLNGLLGAVTCDLLERSGCQFLKPAQWRFSDLANADTCTDLSGSLEKLDAWLSQILPGLDLLVVAARELPREAYDLINRQCLQHHTRWLRGHDDLVQLEVGPFIDPYSSACYTCMSMREAAATDQPFEEELYQRSLLGGEAGAGGEGECIPFTTIGASLLATEAVRITTGVAAPSLSNRVVSIALDGTMTTNKFLRVPRCPDCYRGAQSVPG